MSVASWARRAARLPVAFAQVREDPRIDLAVLERCDPSRSPRARVLMVASGGCTAALLSSDRRVRDIHAVDVNPAQLALTRVKLEMLGTCSGPLRAALLGHLPMDPGKRRVGLEIVTRSADVPLERLGPLDDLSRHGPDHCGRYERVFAALREAIDCPEQLLEALTLDDPREQAALVAPKTAIGRGLTSAFHETM